MDPLEVKIRPGDLQDAIENILRDYGDLVFEATDEALGEAQKVLIKNLKDASPRRTGRLAKNWKGKRYRGMRAVYNSTMVPGKNGEIPLSNILEYSPVRGKPFIKKTFDSSVNEMAQAVVNKIKNEV